MVLGFCCPFGVFQKVAGFVSVFFSFELFKLYPVKTHDFERSFIFCFFFVCKQVALNFHRHVVAVPALVTMSSLAKNTQKLNISGLDFLILVLQSSNSFDLNVFFQVLLSLNITVYKDDIQLPVSGTCCPTPFFSKIENIVSGLFFRLSSSNFSPLKPCFRKAFHSLFLFVCNQGALKFHLHVIAVPLSMNMSSLAKNTQKVNISGLDFLNLVLQSSNSFDLNAFFQVLLSSNITVYQDDIQFMVSRSCCPAGFFSKFENFVSALFFRFSSSNFSPLKPCFRKVFQFLLFFVCKHGALNFHLHVVTVPASVIMSSLAKNT